MEDGINSNLSDCGTASPGWLLKTSACAAHAGSHNGPVFGRGRFLHYVSSSTVIARSR